MLWIRSAQPCRLARKLLYWGQHKSLVQQNLGFSILWTIELHDFSLRCWIYDTESLNFGIPKSEKIIIFFILWVVKISVLWQTLTRLLLAIDASLAVDIYDFLDELHLAFQNPWRILTLFLDKVTSSCSLVAFSLINVYILSSDILSLTEVTLRFLFTNQTWWHFLRLAL